MTSDSVTDSAVPSDLQSVFQTMVDAADSPSAISQFAAGFLAPLAGLRFAIARREYLKLMILPVLIQTALSLGLIMLLWFLGSYAAEGLSSLIGATLESVSDDASTESFEYWSGLVSKLVIFVLGWYVFQLTWRLTGGVFNDFAGDKITNRVMRDLKLNKTNRSASLAGTIVGELLLVAQIHIAGIVTTPLSLVAAVGSILAFLATLAIGLFLKGRADLTDPLLGFGLSKKEASTLCWQRKWMTLGLGASRILAEPIPAIGGIASASESIGRVILAARITDSCSSSSGEVADSISSNTDRS